MIVGLDNERTIRFSVKVRRDKDGKEMRKSENVLAEFGIHLSQANIQHVEMDKGFQEKLIEQREASCPGHHRATEYAERKRA